ncbi:CBS domain-containing protein [Haloechinothrix sp. LS1_15]|nr:CBS domain-containing protein [Haloechinothrix sp. LS1_15]
MRATVASVMTADPRTVRVHTPFKEIVRLLADNGISAVPVLDAFGEPVGVVSEMDLVVKHLHHPGEKRPGFLVNPLLRRRWRKAEALVARDLMTAPVRTVDARASIQDAVNALLHEGMRRLFVVDGGKVVGVLSRRDLLRIFRRPDRDIARDVESGLVRDAHRSDPHEVQVDVEDGVVTLLGTVPRRGDASRAAELASQVPGVVGIRNRLVPTVDAIDRGQLA